MDIVYILLKVMLHNYVHLPKFAYYALKKGNFYCMYISINLILNALKKIMSGNFVKRGGLNRCVSSLLPEILWR